MREASEGVTEALRTWRCREAQGGARREGVEQRARRDAGRCDSRRGEVGRGRVTYRRSIERTSRTRCVGRWYRERRDELRASPRVTPPSTHARTRL